MPRSFRLTTGTLLVSLAMCTHPKRNSLISRGPKVWTSARLRKRFRTGSDKGKPMSVGLMEAPKAEARPVAPNGKNEEKLEKKNRSATKSRPPLKLRSQLTVNWSSAKIGRAHV